MSVTRLVRLLDADPDLGEGLQGEQLALARRVVVAAVVDVEARQPLTDVLAHTDADRLLGLLIVEGLAIRRVELVDRAGIELLGAGDLVRPWEAGGELGSVPARVNWRASSTIRLAVLDDEVHHMLSRFPAILRNLLARMARRADTLALNLAVAQLPRIDGRLLVLFWHLADRFGRVEHDHIVVPLALSHSTLAELVFARRPSVSKALHDLAERRLLVREANDRWVLHGGPPATGAAVAADINALVPGVSARASGAATSRY